MEIFFQSNICLITNFRISNIGFIFQEFELIEYLNVLDNILLPYRVNSSLRFNKAVRDRAVCLAESVGIGDKLRRHPDALSQGEKQRVAICRALVTEPKIIVADEPTGSLDSENKKSIMKIIHDQIDKSRATLLMVTHDHSLLDGFDRVVDLTGDKIG